VTSPAPASWIFLTIGLGGSTFLQPPDSNPAKRLTTIKLLTFKGSSAELVFLVVGHHVLLAENLLPSRSRCLFLLNLLRLICLFTLKVG